VRTGSPRPSVPPGCCRANVRQYGRSTRRRTRWPLRGRRSSNARIVRANVDLIGASRMDSSFAGRVIAVTGGFGVLGRALADVLVGAGACAALLDVARAPSGLPEGT